MLTDGTSVACWVTRGRQAAASQRRPRGHTFASAIPAGGENPEDLSGAAQVQVQVPASLSQVAHTSADGQQRAWRLPDRVEGGTIPPLCSDTTDPAVGPEANASVALAQRARLAAGLLGRRGQHFVHADHGLGGCCLLAVGIVRRRIRILATELFAGRPGGVSNALLQLHGTGM